MLEKIVVLLIVGVVALMIFGNRVPQVMGDLGKGLKAFKDGLSEGSEGENGASGTKKRKPTAKKTFSKKGK